MSQDLTHRGPDDCGNLFLSGTTEIRDLTRVGHEIPPGVVLLHRRLAVIDLSAAGRQPMSTDDGRYHIVYNGEVYNYRELRSQLQAVGHSFRTSTDTEVVLASFRAWGSGAFARFIGMYSIVVVDLLEGTLTAARDRFGIKPLYYARWRSGLAFCSEPAPLLALPGVSRQVNPDRLHRYLRFGQSDDGDQTFFADIRQLPAATYLSTDLSATATGEYIEYAGPSDLETSSSSPDKAASELRSRFLSSVELHLRSDAPLAATLSGGIDSSAIVSAIRHLDPRREIHTFSFDAGATDINERSWIDRVAQDKRTTSHVLTIQPSELRADVDRLILVQGEPMRSTSIYAQYRIFQAVRNAGIKVVLDGQGADEIFAGYRRFLAARLATLVCGGKISRAARFGMAASARPGVGRWWLAQSAGEYLLTPSMAAAMRRTVGRELTPDWMQWSWFHDRGVVAIGPRARYDSAILRSDLSSSRRLSPLPQLLRYQDRNSMAWSVESRVPFLTQQLVDYSCTLPDDLLISEDGTTKAVLRLAMRGIVPDEILDRRDKIGFQTPESVWLRELRPWVSEVLGDSAGAVPALDVNAIRQHWDRIAAANAPIDEHVWRWVNLIQWTREFDVAY